VKVVLLPSSVSERGHDQRQFLTSYLINDVLAIDAGPLGLYGSAAQQGRVRNVLLSHCHFDHIGSLPIFVENAFEHGRGGVTIHGSEPVLDSLRRDVFNDRVWPDFIRLSAGKMEFLRLSVLRAHEPIELEGLQITPVPIDHVVPTFGFVINDGVSTIIMVFDTGPTDAIWEYANRAANLKAIIVPVAFPNAMMELASVAMHLTPSLLGLELGKLKHKPRILAVHLKARYRATTLNELAELHIPELEIGQFDVPYTF
jgi:ribonuclease BN (tRNA processing enzyme)